MAIDQHVNSTQGTKTLPCGCVRGHFLCPEAERLWAETERTFRLGMKLGKWDMFDQAALRYKAHVREEESRA
jgi:hypothetical protein